MKKGRIPGNRGQRDIRKKLITVCIIICLCFIWGQSFLPESDSAQESGFVLNRLVHPLEVWLFGHASSTDHQVRKAAHVFEFMVLSLGLALFFRIRAERKKEKTVRWVAAAFSAGLLTALVDETIQLFSGRGSLISDVWVDGIGVVLGTLIAAGTAFLQYKTAGRPEGKQIRTGKHRPEPETRTEKTEDGKQETGTEQEKTEKQGRNRETGAGMGKNK